jgi:hypothetical protein
LHFIAIFVKILVVQQAQAGRQCGEKCEKKVRKLFGDI